MGVIVCVVSPRAAREAEQEIRDRMTARLVSDRKGVNTDRAMQWLSAAAAQGHVLAAKDFQRVRRDMGGLFPHLYPVVGDAASPSIAAPNPAVGAPPTAPYHAMVTALSDVESATVVAPEGYNPAAEREGEVCLESTPTHIHTSLTNILLSPSAGMSRWLLGQGWDGCEGVTTRTGQAIGPHLHALVMLRWTRRTPSVCSN